MRFHERGGCCCERCGNLGNGIGFSDVYFKGAYKDPHLIDVNKPEQKDGVWIESRAQKAEIMKRLGVREVGDKRHGARNENKFAWRKEREKGHFS